MSDEKDNGYRHILKYTSIFGSVQGLNVLAALVRNKFAAVLLGPAGIGLVSLLNTWQGFVSQTTNFGISFGSIPRMSELYEQGDERALQEQMIVIRTWSFLAAFLGFLMCIVATPLMNSYMGDGHDYTLYLILVAPAIAMLAITGGETAILKAARRLKALAKVQFVAALASVVISIPLYYLYGKDGIVPVMLLMALVTMVVTMGYSYRHYPLKLRFSRQVYVEGKDMIILGIAFTLSAIIGQIGEMFIRLFLNSHGQLSEVGLYNAAYTLTISYAALVLASVDSDYFPRLSAICHDRSQSVGVVNRQVEVFLLLLSPMLIALIIFLPLLVPMLYSNQFFAIIPMAQLSVIAMFFKALSLPVCYLPLAHRDSSLFLSLEISYWVYFLVFFIIGYSLWGIWGTGVAIVLAHVVEWVLAALLTRKRYQYHLFPSLIKGGSIQLALLVIAYMITLSLSDGIYWLVGGVVIIVSTGYSCWSFYHFRKN